LATTHRVVVLDLKGYGRSSAPAGDPAHLSYSKATWAKEAADVMTQLGHHRFSVVGHDRGAQVAYKLALDFPSEMPASALVRRQHIDGEACMEQILKPYSLWKTQTAETADVRPSFLVRPYADNRMWQPLTLT
ncbi:MAG: alpha/beta fold hydrolase, partial [Alphaproteobacteria bacterium]